MTTTEATSRMAAALAEVQANLPVIHKANSADTGKYTYKYADLAEIAGAVYPLLSKAGLAWTTLPTLDDKGAFVLRYELMHTSGETRIGTYPLPNPASAQPQAVGSAITYARRYTLCAVVGVAPDEDDDGQAAARERRRKQEMADNARARLRATCEEHGWDLGEIAAQYANTHHLSLREEDDGGAIEKFRANLLDEWTSKPATAHERTTGRPAQPGAEQAGNATGEPERLPDEWQNAIEHLAEAGDVDGLKTLYRKAKAERPTDVELREHITTVANQVKARLAESAVDEPVDAEGVEAPPVDQKQQRHMHALWKKAGVTEREERLAVTSHLIGHDVASSKELTYADAETVIAQLAAFGDDTAALKSQIVRWLGDYHGAYDDEPTDATAEATS